MLTRIHADIDACRVCASLAGFKKPTSIARGRASRLMVIGEAPGNTEIGSGLAFSGAAGRRLFQWLNRCGVSDPRADAYLTAAVKCVPGKPAHLPRMLGNCRRFLHAQLAAVRPSLVITLGALAYSEMAIGTEPYSAALCSLRRTEDLFMLPPEGFHLAVMPWPHPSGRARWLNAPENRNRLEASFAGVRTFLEGGDSA